MLIMANQNAQTATVKRPAKEVREIVAGRPDDLPLGTYNGRWRGHRVQVKMLGGKVVKLTTEASAGQDWRPCSVEAFENVVEVTTRSPIPRRVPAKRKQSPKGPESESTTGGGQPRNNRIAPAARKLELQGTHRPEARRATAPINTGGEGPFTGTNASAPEMALHALALITAEMFPPAFAAYPLYVRELAMRGQFGDRDGVEAMIRQIPAVARVVLGG